MSLEIEKKEVGEFIVLTLEGEFHVSDLMSVKTSFLESFNSGKTYIAINMAKVNHIDSSGIGLLRNILTKINNSEEGQLVLISINSMIETTLKQTGLLHSFTIVKSENEFKDTFIL